MDKNQLISKIKSSIVTSTSSVVSFIRKLLKSKTQREKSRGSESGSIMSSSANKSILRKIKIKTRLIASFVLLLIAMLLITGIFSYSSSTKTIDDKVKSYSLQVMGQTSVVLNNEIIRMEGYFTDIGLSSVVQDGLSKNETDDYEKLVQAKYISDFMTKKFVTTNDIVYCGLLYGDNYSQESAYNNSSQIDIEAVGKKDLKQVQWSDFDVQLGAGRKDILFGMQKKY